MSLDEATPEAWNDQDLAAMLRHQFVAPLEFDLGRVEMKSAEARKRDQALTAAAQAQIRSFEDLLFHRDPPLELLKLAKEFFKRRLQQYERDSPEWNVAYLLYLLSILAAGTRAAIISTLTHDELLKGIKWALGAKWVDERTKSLLTRERAV